MVVVSVGGAAVEVVFVLEVLLMVGEGNIEVKGLVALAKAEAEEDVLPMAVLDAEDDVAGGVEDGFNGGVTVSKEEGGGGKYVAGDGVHEADLAAVTAGDGAEVAGPDLVRVEPLVALAEDRNRGW